MGHGCGDLKRRIDMRISGTRFLKLHHMESFYPKQRIGMLGLVSSWVCESFLKSCMPFGLPDFRKLLIWRP